MLPDIPASAVGFDFGTEGEIARYRTPAGPVTLAVFSFPLPSMARQQLPQFQKITGASAKRTGPLDRRCHRTLGRLAAKLVESVNYQGVVAENEKPPDEAARTQAGERRKDGFGDSQPCRRYCSAFCLLSGLAVGGTLRLARRFGYSAAEGCADHTSSRGQITPPISPP